MKKIFVLLLSGVILATSVPMNSYAAAGGVNATTDATMIKAEPPATRNVEPTNQSLEEAIKAIKAKITIPSGYSDFNYYFNNTSSYSDANWSLTWSNPSTSASIQVNCDADYHITYYSQYDYSGKASSIAKYLKKELKATADAFIKKVAPEISTKLEYLSASYEGVYSGNYVYQYQRSNDGVAFPDNTVNVSVNSVSGEVSGISINWIYDATVPSNSKKITKEEAKKLLKEKLTMKLVYHTDYYSIYDKIGNTENTSKKAYLVYEPSESYISVDAKTGEIYLTRSEWVNTASENGYGKAEKAADTASSEASAWALTEEEIAKIEELKDLISKAKAIKIITSNDYLYIDKTLKSYSATLSKQDNGSGDTSYVWNISLSDPREINYDKETDFYRAYAYARVDAKTGKILSFYASVKSNYDEASQTWKTVTIPYNKKEGREILEKFLSTQIKEHFNNSIISSSNEDYIAYYKEKTPIYGGYNYQYNRVNEGVEYPYNSIYGSLDGVTGKIYSYGFNWDNNVVFESPKGAMTAAEALTKYLSKDGFDLKYEVNVINKYDSSYEKVADYYEAKDAYSVEYEVRLVYRPDINPSYISPFTGEQLNYDGQVYTKTVPYTYQDIQETDANRGIRLLADMEIGFTGDKFLPDQAITKGELNEILQKIGYGATLDESKANEVISREEIAQTFIIRLGLEKVAKLAGIYKTGYADDDTIASKYYGAVAIAKGLGLIEANSDNYFNPKNNVTRFDAVKLIMNFIEAQQNGIYY